MAKSAATLANVRTLQQALPLINGLAATNFGPTSPEFTRAKATLTALGILGPATTDADVRQEIGKYLLRYASNAQAAGRSDQALSAALGSNPNADTMTKPATLALVRNQIGLDRMDAALPNVAGTSAGYKTFKSNYYQNMDPRAFSIDMMTPDEIHNLKTTLKGPERAKFIKSLQAAQTVGVQMPGAQSAGQ